MYVFLKQWEKYFYLLVMYYKLLLCHKIPQCNISDHCSLGALVISHTLSSTHHLFFCIHISLSLVNDGYILFCYVFLTKIYKINSSSSSCFTGNTKLFCFIKTTFKSRKPSDVCYKLFISILLLHSLPHTLFIKWLQGLCPIFIVAPFSVLDVFSN